MNERIRELAEQAGIWKPTHDHKTWVRGEYVASPGELEKFAELIIRECAVLVEEFTYLEEMDLDDYKEITGKEMILSTFGVE